MANQLQKMGLEKELKYFLTRQDYDKLLNACEPKVTSVAKQVNYYFDDKKLRLRKKRIGLRLRIVDGKRAIVTLKHPAKGSTPKVPSLKIRQEYEEEIPLSVAKLILKKKKNLLDLNITPIAVLKVFYPKRALLKVQLLGSVETVRTIVKLKKKLELELDRFRMFDEKYYELEVETTDPRNADRTVRTLFAKAGIPYLPITKSKLGRFIDAWKGFNRA